MNCSCFKDISAKVKVTSNIKTVTSGPSAMSTKVEVKSSITNTLGVLTDNSATFNIGSYIEPVLNVDFNLSTGLIGVSRVGQSVVNNPNINEKLSSSFGLDVEIEKFAGKFSNFAGYDRLYPNSGINLSDYNAVGAPHIEAIDEGSFTGLYHINGEQSEPLFDDTNYIESSGVETSLKVALTNPTVSFKESYLIIRAASDDTVQSIYDIRFEDPNGQLVCEYDSIDFIGDKYFSTYAAQPKVNNGALYTWDSDYPAFDIGMSGNFTLSFKTKSSYKNGKSLFGEGFGEGFAAYSNSGVPNIRISTIEVLNSGEFGYRRDNLLPFFTDVRPKGDRLEMCIKPKSILDEQSEVWPEVDSSWYGSANEISKPYDNSFIRLEEASIADSGKLFLQFQQETPGYHFSYKGGAFGLGFDPSEFEVAEKTKQGGHDAWFTVDEVYLKVRARKASGSRDYAIDVVGWSDDGLLNVTSPVGGFLQNSGDSLHNIPVESGFNDRSANSETAISEGEIYYENNETNNPGGDHYYISPTIVDSEDYKEYIVPLKVYEDNVSIGKSVDYGQSSYFENLFLDIYPIPSGAEFSSVELCITYKPSNALSMSVLGGNLARIENDRSETTLKPVQVGSGNLVNHGSGQPYSLIENIPHGYGRPDSLKSNYTKKWRPAEGLAYSAFDQTEFDFSFQRDPIDNPFLDAFFKFDKVIGSNVYSNAGSGNLSISILPQNSVESFAGARFIEDLSAPYGYKSVDQTGKHNDSFSSYMVDAGQRVNFIEEVAESFSIYFRFFQFSDSIKNEDPIVVLEDDLIIWYNKAAGTIRLHARDSFGNFNNYYYIGTNQPISVLLTYDKDSDRMFLYAYNEFEDIYFEEEVLDNFNYVPGKLFRSSDLGLPLLELGYSSQANLLDSSKTPDPNKQEQYAETFLKSLAHSDYINGQDLSVIPNYIDENTSQFDLGAFKFTQFANHEFDTFTQRVGKDYVSFNLVSSGDPYSSFVDLPFPSSIDPDLSYHTQIENDFLRLQLSDSSDNFYSTTPRISKSLPRGYHYNDRAIVVESVIDYSQSGNIVWDNGESGAKLIVSLYTTNKESSYPVIDNVGLVNRKIHYLDPYTSWEKLNSTFDPNSYFDETEDWAKFPGETRLSELNEKYFSKDIDDMFLQYDLALPSGEPFEIKLNLHAANVKLENALFDFTSMFESLPVSISGVEQYTPGFLRLTTDSHGVDFESMNLYLSGVPTPTDTSAVNLYASGANVYTSPLDLHTINIKEDSDSMNLYSSGNYISDSSINLHLYNDQESFPSDVLLPLYSFGDVKTSLRDAINMVAYNNVKAKKLGVYSDSVPMFVGAVADDSTKVSSSSVSLHLAGPQIFGESLNLVLYGKDSVGLTKEESVNLHTVCYPSVYLNGSGSPYIGWTSSNPGVSTEESDESNFLIPSSDEIRGVNTTCFGDCTTPSGGCVEEDIISHDTNWADKECLDGGIFRASSTYSNDVYDGNFHGTRKYTGLLPNTPYNIKVTSRAGDSQPFELPRMWEEVEYGTLGDIQYSGNKIVEPVRNSGDNYGKSVSVKKDVMAVGAPNYNLSFNSQEYKDAGAVYLYRRDTPVDSGGKTGWTLEETISLPSGFVGDYYEEVDGGVSYPGIGNIPEKQWYIGQEGRELGHSVSLSSHKGREVLVAGGPGAKWTTRSFDEIATSGVNVGIVIVNNEFEYTSSDITAIVEKVKSHNFLYKYFSSPPINLNVKIIACVPTGLFDSEIKLDPYAAQHVVVKKIPRHTLNQPKDPSVTAAIFSGVKSGFLEAFPYDNDEVNNNIPPLVGFYVDNSRSLGREAVEPAIDQFANFYKNYSFNSGVRDFYGVQSSGYIYEYTPTAEDNGEDWYTVTNNMLDYILDTGNMVSRGVETLLTSGIGLEYSNPDALEFNSPPDSGGRAYIFEKEGGSWNLIQQVKSSNEMDNVQPSRFGHSVAISDDGSTVSIGSPFTRESCVILERDESEDRRLYNTVGTWLTSNNHSLSSRYQDLQAESGSYSAGQQVYSELNPTEKYQLRLDYKIEPYKTVVKYGLDDVTDNLDGLFKQPALSASNPRLGYSTAIDASGKIVAFGSPTDGWGLYDNSDIYFKHEFYQDPENSGQSLPENGVWASNLNAGSVRIFEKGSDFTPITDTSTVEYNKFGNLSNTLNNTETYDELGNEENTTAISQSENYSKTDFGTVRIPDELSSIFIITPEIDAANDEVIAEIKRWMSLGDRKLVLVGDDPVWENNGAYEESNKIINKILDKLGSRMRLHPAKDPREALIVNNSCENGFNKNVIESYVPQGSNETTLDTSGGLHAFGVADIKLHVPEITFTSDNWGKDNIVIDNKRYGRCSFYNTLCGPPIAHEGDLRARWTERELRFPTDPEANDPYVYWERNLPFEFFSSGLPRVSSDNATDIANDLGLIAPGEQPRPIMVAAEFTENIGVIPSIPEQTEIVEITESVVYNENEVKTYYQFEDIHNSGVEFLWSEDSSNFIYINDNIGRNQSEGVFFNPAEFNGRNALLQAEATLDIEVTKKDLTEHFKVDDISNVVAKQSFADSHVYLIATLDSESKESLSFGNDENISFYDNLVRQPNCDNSKIVQIGGWTGNNTFKDANPKSLLKNLFLSMGHSVTEGWANENIPNSVNVSWIANCKDLPSDSEVAKLKAWLNSGGKKLVITYSEDPQRAANTLYLCEKLGLDIKPWYLSGANTMPVLGDIRFKQNFVDFSNHQVIDSDQSFAGCNGENSVSSLKFEKVFIPIRLNTKGRSVLHYENEIRDERLSVSEEYDEIWRMNTGVANVQFSGIPGSGYRVFYNWVSDLPEEKEPLYLYIEEGHYRSKPGTKAQNPSGVVSNGYIGIKEFDEDGDSYSIANGVVKRKLESPSFGPNVYEDYIDIQLPYDIDHVSIYITGNNNSLKVTNGQAPKTVKLVSVSGALLPIDEVTEVVTSTRTETEVVGYETIVTQEYQPPRTLLLPATIKPIMNDNTRYCQDADCGGKLVADGPVVIAEEPENFSNFVTGKTRSSIVLISDSTIVNGCLDDSSNIVDETVLVSGVPTMDVETRNSRLQSFINSIKDSPANVSSSSYIDDRFTYSTKIVSPQKGSPSIYGFAAEDADYGNLFSGSGYVDNISNFADDADYNLEHLVPHLYPEEKFEKAEKRVNEEFESSKSYYALENRMTTTYNGNTYTDTPISGAPYSDMLRETGKDFIDYDITSGNYPGDLFGRDLDIHNGKLVVGAPYSSYLSSQVKLSGIVDRSQLSASLEIGSEGGAGAAYVFERDNQVGWHSVEKLKTSGVSSDVNSDRLGWSVAYDGDFVALGAPGHDYGNIITEQSGEFVRKEFDGQFDIGVRNVYDAGVSGVGLDTNIGAVYLFEDRIQEWDGRVTEWTFAEKVVPHGYGYDQNNTHFGDSVSLSRFARTDSDYALSVGSPDHKYDVSSSGDTLNRAGASYVFDSMLRNQPPVVVGSSIWMDGYAFGQNRDLDQVRITVDTKNQYSDGQKVTSSGMIYSDSKGQIFIEVSGQDPRDIGFISQRPYIERIDGSVVYGDPSESIFNMYVEGSPYKDNNSMNLHMAGPTSDIVYNNMTLHTQSAYVSDVPSGINLIVDAAQPTEITNSGLIFHTDGIGLLNPSLDLRIRGK